MPLAQKSNKNRSRLLKEYKGQYKFYALLSLVKEASIQGVAIMLMHKAPYPLLWEETFYHFCLSVNLQLENC